jgi:hypothetical protein
MTSFSTAGSGALHRRKFPLVGNEIATGRVALSEAQA